MKGFGKSGCPLMTRPQVALLWLASLLFSNPSFAGQNAGSLDLSFNPGSGANDSISCLAVQPDGKIVIGGTFTEVNGVPRRRLARFKPDGTLDSTFDPASGPNLFVSAIVLQPDGKLLIGGGFTTING